MSERGTCRYEPETIGYMWYDYDENKHLNPPLKHRDTANKRSTLA